MDHAAPHSTVGLIGAYAAEAQTMTTEEAQAALGAISNKSSPVADPDADLNAVDAQTVDVVDAEVVAEVNGLLGVTNEGEEEEEE